MLDSVRNGEQLSERLIIHLNEIINKNIMETSGNRNIQVYIRGAKDIPPSPLEVTLN